MIPPVNMLAYQLMGLEDWNVSTDAIKAAYRRKAPTLHPDKLPAQEKELATLDIQQLNAVRDMLLDARERRQYHMDGKIPWVI
jgi:curved DNA-binding protein CbpA